MLNFSQYKQKLYTGIAQLVERRSPKPKAVGSIPTARAILIVDVVYQLMSNYGKYKVVHQREL